MVLFNIIVITVSFLILVALYAFYRIIVKPCLLLRYYKNQGLETYFYPMTGELNHLYDAVDRYGDIYYNYKQKNFQSPKPRAWAGNLADTVIVMIKDSQLIKNYFLHQERYIKYEPMTMFIKQISGDGILFSEGAIWKKHRKVTSSVFNYEYLREMVTDIVDVGDAYLDKLKKKDNNNVDILSEFQIITGEVISRIFFGEDLTNYMYEGKPLTDCLAHLIVSGGMQNLTGIAMFIGKKALEWNLWPGQRELKAQANKFKDIMRNLTRQKMAEIAEREQKGENNIVKRKGFNILEVFHKQRKENPAEALTDDEIVDGCINFLQAGTDGTAHLLQIATYYYLVNPECHDKVMKEVNEYLSDANEITIETLNKMEYLTAFMKECLRMTPTAGGLFPREALVDHDLGGLKIKKGSLVNIPFLSNYFDPDYHQEPEKFMPERWIYEDSKSKKVVAEQPWTYAPFSAGSRNCVGQHLGLYEAKVVFGMFLRKFDYELVDKNYKLRFTERALYEPVDPIIYNIRPKS